MFKTLHARLGDFWWYSAMIFLACRAGDVIQLFIALWLVPMYVGEGELGAVLPLQQLCALFAVPLAIIATVFSKYVNTYATHGEFGKVKSFVLDVMKASVLVFLVCMGVAYLVVPHFYERLRIASGSLTFLILAAGFAVNVAALFNSVLQGLKKFKTMTVVNFIGAPIRLVTLLVAMPVRALSGYVLGQATPPAASSLIAAFSIRRELRNTPVDRTWRRDIPSILHYFWPVAIYTAFVALFAAVSATVYRQRLPEVESAAYYMISRFAEVAGYISISMSVVMFPLAAEAHERGSEDLLGLKRTILGTAVGTALLCTVYWLIGDFVFSMLGEWRQYGRFVYLLPWTTLSMGVSGVLTVVVTYEMACRRFGIPFTMLLCNFLWTAFLVCFTGYEAFRGVLPDSFVDWMSACNVARLSTLTYFLLFVNVLQLLLAAVLFAIGSRRSRKG